MSVTRQYIAEVCQQEAKACHQADGVAVKPESTEMSRERCIAYEFKCLWEEEFAIFYL